MSVPPLTECIKDFEFKLYDTSEEVVPLRKTSQTIGKCCQLGKAMSKLTGGLSDVYLTQSELNNERSSPWSLFPVRP